MERSESVLQDVLTATALPVSVDIPMTTSHKPVLSVLPNAKAATLITSPNVLHVQLAHTTPT